MNETNETKQNTTKQHKITQNKRRSMKHLLSFTIGVLFLNSAMATMGTGVGNGTNGEGAVSSAGNIEAMQTHNNTGMSHYQPYSPAEIQSVNGWGAQSTYLLRVALGEAAVQKANGNTLQATKILQKALEDMKKGFPKKPAGQDAPITQKLVNRALQYLKVIQRSFKRNGYDLLEQRTEFYFIYEYSSMIIEAWNDLDRDYYIPYYHQHHRCYHYPCPSHFDHNAFTRKYIAFARKELAFVIDRFLADLQHPHYSYSKKVPVGDPRAVLVLAELTSYNVARDVSQTLWAYQNTRSIQMLRALNLQLQKFNSGRGGYVDLKHAINGFGGIFPVISSAIAELGGNGFYTNYSNSYTKKHCSKTIDVDATISGAGNEKTFSLPTGRRHVKRVVPHAQAYGADAQVHVRVNGKFNGTMDIPQYDPPYSIPVNGYANNITFHITRGKEVEISKIEIIFCE